MARRASQERLHWRVATIAEASLPRDDERVLQQFFGKLRRSPEGAQVTPDASLMSLHQPAQIYVRRGCRVVTGVLRAGLIWHLGDGTSGSHGDRSPLSHKAIQAESGFSAGGRVEFGVATTCQATNPAARTHLGAGSLAESADSPLFSFANLHRNTRRSKPKRSATGCQRLFAAWRARC